VNKFELMGGEFFLKVREENNITPAKWRAALMMIQMALKSKIEDDDHLFHPPSEIYAFEYTDPVEKWGGAEPVAKSFKLKWEWGPDAVESKLGGRRRTNWENVLTLCQTLCYLLPDQMAVVVCDGISGYYGDDSYCDGTPGDRNNMMKPLKYDKWPWV